MCQIIIILFLKIQFNKFKNSIKKNALKIIFAKNAPQTPIIVKEEKSHAKQYKI